MELDAKTSSYRYVDAKARARRVYQERDADQDLLDAPFCHPNRKHNRVPALATPWQAAWMPVLSTVSTPRSG